MPGRSWGKFFWNDWQGDPCLKVCSLAAQGLWMRMLCLAAESSPTGYVTLAGRPVTTTDLSRLTGATEAQIDELVADLDRNGVFSRDSKGRIYSRRMVKDWKRSQEGKKHIKKRWRQIADKQNENDLPNRVPNRVPIRGPTTQKPESKNPEEEKLESESTAPRERTKQAIADCVAALTKPTNGSGTVNYADPANRKARWQQKIANELHRRYPTERAEIIIDAYARGEKWAKDEFEAMDQYVKKRRAVAGVER